MLSKFEPPWVTKIFTSTRGSVGIPQETPKLATSSRGSVEATREYPVPLGLAGFGLINDELLLFQISFKASYRQIPSISEEMYQRDVAQFLFAMLSTYLASGVEKKFLFLNLETILQCKPNASNETRRRKIE